MTKFNKINSVLFDEKTKDGSRFIGFTHGNKDYRFVSNPWYEFYEGELNFQVFMSAVIEREVLHLNNFDLTGYIVDYLKLDLDDSLDYDLKNKLIELESEIKKNIEGFDLIFNRIEFSCKFHNDLNCWSFDIGFYDWARDINKIYVYGRYSSDNTKINHFLRVSKDKNKIIDVKIDI